MTADVQRELAEALRDLTPLTGWQRDLRRYGLTEHQADGLAAALLPVVERAEKRAAARALRRAALSAPVVRYDTGGYPVRAVPVSELLSAAAALDPSGAAEGAGR